MFKNITERIETVLRKLRGKGKLSEQDVDEALRDLRVVLLEADVNYQVVRDFISRVRARAVGQDVLRSLTPGQQVIKAVHEELSTLLGGRHVGLRFSSTPPTVIMLVGLQGTGKTTTAAKLAWHLKEQGKRILLVATDTKRPAAMQQLQALAGRVGVPAFAPAGVLAVDIGRAALEHARSRQVDVMLVDTAGRLHVDEELMRELAVLKGELRPHEVLLVVDAMMGQDAVNMARSFDERLAIDGIVLTKLDSDARGGAALSIAAVTGKPVKFAGVGEKLEALEPFYPDRMAARILGMGDVLTLIEKAERVFQEEKLAKRERRLKADEFTLEDFLAQLGEVRKMGPLDQLLGMIPGVARAGGRGLEIDERRIVKVEAIVNSMTPLERSNPSIIDGSRRRRIASGSGTTVQDVNQLLRQFAEARRMLKHVAELEKGRRRTGKFPPFS